MTNKKKPSKKTALKSKKSLKHKKYKIKSKPIKSKKNRKLSKKSGNLLIKKKFNKIKRRYRFSVRRRKLKKVKIKHIRIIRKKASKKRLFKFRKAKISLPKKSIKRTKKLSIKKLVKNKPKISKSATEFPKESLFKAKIKVIGIGGGGGSIVSEIGRSLQKAKFIVADTDTRNFKKRQGIKYFFFGQKLTHGLGTGLNPGLGKMAAEEERERIVELFKDDDMVIFVASLGGGIGSGAAPVFAEISKDFKGISFGVFTLPFNFEGKSKYKIAYKALRQLRNSLNVSITIPNERIFKVIDTNTAITEAFSLVNKNLIESLESLINLIYNPGVINIDFADLRTILKGKGNLAFLNTVEASGRNKIEKITNELLNNPLYQNNNFIIERILFNIQGGKNLSMFDVDKISKTIADQNLRAKIIFGISKNAKYKDKVKVTILTVGAPIKKDITIKKTVRAPRIIKKLKKKIKKVKIIRKKDKKRKRPTKSLGKSPRLEKIPLLGGLVPAFNNIPVNLEGSVKPTVVEISESRGASQQPTGQLPENIVKSQNQKKAIRRTALEIKKAEELEESKKSQQEKEWEIPAFLRKVKFKP